MEMIDLSLAVNYLPACACVGKTVALAFVLCVIHAGGVTPAYIPVAAALMLDRLVYPSLIMDCNSVLLGIFASHLVWEVQRAADGRWEPWSGLHIILSVGWCVEAGWNMWRKHAPNSITARLHKQNVSFASAMLVIGILAFLRAEEELRIVRFTRYLMYGCLCLAWVYVIGLYQRRMTHASESTTYFTVYFSPILYVHQYAALAYGAFCVVSIATHLHTQTAALLPTTCCDSEPAPPPSTQEWTPQTDAHPPPPEEDPEELERVYRMALGSKSSV